MEGKKLFNKDNKNMYCTDLRHAGLLAAIKTPEI